MSTERPLRLALVSTSWPSDASGGATFEADMLHAVLSVDTAHELLVYPDTPATRAIADEAGATSRVQWVPEVSEPALGTRVVRRALRAMHRRPPPPAFAPLSRTLRDAGAQAAWMLGGALVPLDLPYLATVWDLEHRAQPWFPEVSADGEWRERERLYGEFVRRASGVLAGTTQGAELIRTSYGEPAGGIHVLPLPTPRFALDAAALRTPRRPELCAGRYVLYPAQFWAHKNHVTAVRAIAALQSRGASTPDLVLVGGDRGTREHVLATAAELGVAERVHAPGFVPRELLVALYRHADAMVFPSLFGPDNLPPLEAMALGCPVIAAQLPGAKEQLGTAAIFVEPLDANGFANAIALLQADPALRDTMIERGHRRAASWDGATYACAALRLVDDRIAPIRALWR